MLLPWRTHWIHFVGFENPDPNDDATRILRYTANPLHMTLFQKFYSYRQLSQTFDPGCVVRHSESDKEGEMTWTYGKKPRVTVACARNPNGDWGVALSNFTASSFRNESDTGKFAVDQGGSAGRTFTVTLHIRELVGAGDMPFVLTRSRPGGESMAEGRVLFHNGEAAITLAPLEMVTLRSGKQKSILP